MRPCSICGRPDLAAIDSELARGDSLRTVEAAHPGTGKDALARHKAQGHSGVVAPAPPREAPPKTAPRPRPAKPPPGLLEEPEAEEAPEPAPPSAAPRLRLVPPPQGAGEPPRRGSHRSPRPINPDGTGPRAAAISDREARVREIMSLMTAGAWDVDMNDELAARWGCAVGSVHTYAGEASRRIRAVGEADWVRQRISTALDEALTLGLAMARSGGSKALIGLAQVAKGYSAIAVGNAPSAHAEATFRIEMVSPERPVLEAPTEPPGADDDGRVVN